MPITKSAKKAARVSKRKRHMNMRRTRAMTDAVKTIKKSDLPDRQASFGAALAKAYQAIDKAAKRGIIKKNTAARKKSRVARMLKK